ncbi:hypothetical protein MtrunA17_Chr4g0036881 [Medicago truncatula]|uniref:Transmembrane protein n=1 Tax=Medicago truncatula TaxID=3880 RepID=A0A396I763_MEDTR|nr:hypothetical protein MtrunA17_Chr4g0036881 [Medicago truncatula]
MYVLYNTFTIPCLEVSNMGDQIHLSPVSLCLLGIEFIVSIVLIVEYDSSA